MKLSKPINPQYYQPPLFPLESYYCKQDDGHRNRPITNLGTCRVVLGEFIETLTAKLFNGQRHKTNSTCEYCPDVSVSREVFGKLNPAWHILHAGSRRQKHCDTAYLECKGSGKNGDVIIYSGRLTKDRLFARHHELYYCIWHHKTSCTLSTGKLIPDTAILRDQFLLSICGVYILHLTEIVKLARHAKQLLTFTSNLYCSKGNNKEKYKHGYRIKLKDIQNSRHTFIEYQVDNITL